MLTIACPYALPICRDKRCVGQDWNLILPLLIDIGFVVEGSKYLEIKLLQIENFILLSDNILHIADYHPQYKTKQYFMCKGKPTYSSPAKQILATKMDVFHYEHLRYLTRSDRSLKSKLEDHIDLTQNITYTELVTVEEDRIITLDTTPLISAATEAFIPSPPSLIIRTAPPPLSHKYEDQIIAALSLDLRRYPRPSRYNVNTNIPLQKTQISTQAIRLLILVTAKTWGLNHYTATYAKRMRVARAASRLISYDNGYLFEFSIRSIMRWESEVTTKIQKGVNSTDIITNKYKIRKSMLKE